jgi:RNA polymerase sigma-70 factor (ECF subfamily)
MIPFDPSDPTQVEAFWRKHAPQVLRWVIRLGGPHLDAEDVAQDALVTALRKIGSFRGDSAIRTWLYGVTRRVVANARRRAAFRRFIGLQDIPEPPDLRDLSDIEVERLRERRAVQRALDRLKFRQREVLVLVDLEGRTAPEAAEMLQVPTGTIYSRLHNARKQMAEALKAEGITGAPKLMVIKGGRS